MTREKSGKSDTKTTHIDLNLSYNRFAKSLNTQYRKMALFILKFLYYKRTGLYQSDIEYEVQRNYGGLADTKNALRYLIEKKFAIIETPGENPFYTLTSDGIDYIEMGGLKRFVKDNKDLFAVIISIFSLLVSFAAFVVSIFAYNK